MTLALGVGVSVAWIAAVFPKSEGARGSRRGARVHTDRTAAASEDAAARAFIRNCLARRAFYTDPAGAPSAFSSV